LCCTGHAGTAASPLAAASSVLSKKDALIAQINSPAHLAAKQLMYDRERRVGARIDARLEELRQLLHETQLPEELRVRALIEEKQLKLLAVQKKVRHRIASELRYEMQLVGADDPSLYRRSSKKHTKQTVSKSERQKEREEQVPHTHARTRTHTRAHTHTRTHDTHNAKILTIDSSQNSASSSDRRSSVRRWSTTPRCSASSTRGCSRSGRRCRARW
jgi:hypothetical protein